VICTTFSPGASTVAAPAPCVFSSAISRLFTKCHPERNGFRAKREIRAVEGSLSSSRPSFKTPPCYPTGALKGRGLKPRRQTATKAAGFSP
jgi:hypothetical protein